MLIPFGLQSYQHQSRQLSSQRMVNCFLEQEPAGSKSPIAIIRTPGIETELTLPKSPIRGGLTHRGDPYFVAGDSLYRIAGTEPTDLGKIPGTGFVDMISNNSQLGILADLELHVYESELEKVTDPGFSQATTMTYGDLFGVFAKKDSADFFINDPSVAQFPDLTEYNALDFRTAEAQPGDLVALIMEHRELFLFKEKFTEVWTNTGNADFTFGPIGNAFMELGCIAQRSVAKVDNTVFWLANDQTIRRADGYTPIRISTHAIEEIITKATVKSDAFAISHPYNGHIFYVLTFPTDNITIVYDATTGLWHERETDGSEWRPNVYLYANDKHYIGDSLSGRIGVLNNDTHEDFGFVHRVSVTSPAIHSEGRQMFFRRLHVDFEMGQGATTGQGADPQAMLQWSDDYGKTWSSEHWRSMGKTGEYSRRSVWNRLGSSVGRVFRLSFSEPTPFTVSQAMADVEVGGT